LLLEDVDEDDMNKRLMKYIASTRPTVKKKY